jgi:uncharacterized phiE125 gp8 family phage protein
MSSILLTGPAVEPLSLDDARSFLRVEHGDDDPLIAALIVSARMRRRAGKTALISQDWRIVSIAAASWAHCREAGAAQGAQGRAGLRLSRPTADNRHAGLRAGSRRFDAAFMPWTMPVPGRIAAGIELDVTVGFGDAAADVPEPLRQAIRLLVAHWYENRGLWPPPTKARCCPRPSPH